MQAKDYVEKLVPIYSEVVTLTEDAKEILAQAKKAGMDSASIAKIAKAKAAANLDKLQEGVDALQKLLDEVA